MMKEFEPVQINFAKKGGTWDMNVDSEGHLMGVGNLGDKEVHDLMRRNGLLSVISKEQRLIKEKDLAILLHDRFKNTQPTEQPAGRYFASWCPDFGRYATGNFYSFFSGDSSHLTHPFDAAISTNIIERLLDDPKKIMLGAEGTDTADIAFLNLVDALIFDTKLPPVIFTGANRSRHEENSDAPENFLGLAKMARVNPSLYLPDPQFPSGAFWYFHGYLYSGSDVVKFDPREERIFEGQNTFFSTNSYANLSGNTLSIYRIDQEGDVAVRKKENHSYQDTIDTNWLSQREKPNVHVTRQLTVEKLHEALCSIYTVDLGNQNLVADEVEKILDPSYKAIVVAGHSTGNGSEDIRAALVEAAKMDKIVIVTSRAFIPFVSERYEESLLSANTKSEELLMSRFMIISGQHLNKTAARAITTRAILEGLNQVQAKQLLQEYCQARPPQYGKEVQTSPVLVTAGSSHGRGGVAVVEGETQVEQSGFKKIGEDFINVWSRIKRGDIVSNINEFVESWRYLSSGMNLSNFAKTYLYQVLITSAFDNYSPIGRLPLGVLNIDLSQGRLGPFDPQANQALLEKSLIEHHQAMMDNNVHVIFKGRRSADLSKVFSGQLPGSGGEYDDTAFHALWEEDYKTTFG